MRIEILSLSALEARSQKPFISATSLVSIGDPDAPPPRLLHKPRYSLRLIFDDLTPEEAAERLALPMLLSLPEEKQRALLNRYQTSLFDERMARRLAAFVYGHFTETETLICQCEHGMSRSAACAAAISERFFSNGEVIFTDPRYHPNQWVYQKALAALCHCC